jgi:arylsulfatase A-like enzyme
MSDETDTPNILLLCSDQQHPAFVGMNPNVPVRTPTIESLAERGTYFEEAVCPVPVCNPCRASIATGYEYDRCGVPANHTDLPLDRPTYQQRLRDEAGYHVMGCGKFDLTTDFPLDITGDDRVERWGYSDAIFNPAKNNTLRRIVSDSNGGPRDPYTKYLADHDLLDNHLEDYLQRDEGATLGEPEGFNAGRWTATFPTTLPDHAYYDNWITRQGETLLERAPDDSPWFLEVNFQNPHDPWDVTEGMYETYRNPDVDFPEPVDPGQFVAPETHQEIRRNYAAMVEHLDQCVDRLLQKVEERGELEETLVVYVADHGEMLGDHGQWAKQSPLQASVGVPFVVAGPGVQNRGTVQDLATILDLHSTFLDYAGVEPAPDVDSRSMRGYLSGDVDRHRDIVYSALSSWRMVYDGQYKLVRGYDPAQRRGDDHEPQAVGRRIAARRREERPAILHEVSESETENLAQAHPDVVEDLSRRMAGFAAIE